MGLVLCMNKKYRTMGGVEATQCIWHYCSGWLSSRMPMRGFGLIWVINLLTVSRFLFKPGAVFL